jgi:hypothetical protein
MVEAKRHQVRKRMNYGTEPFVTRCGTASGAIWDPRVLQGALVLALCA